MIVIDSWKHYHDSTIRAVTIMMHQTIDVSLHPYSWFIAVKEIFIKYNLPDPYDLLKDPPTKFHWRRIVNKHVNSHWESSIKENAVLYSSLRILNVSGFACGKRHPLLRTLGNIREVPHTSTKLKLVTGTYILQTNRATFKQNCVDPVCLLSEVIKRMRP